MARGRGRGARSRLNTWVVQVGLVVLVPIVTRLVVYVIVSRGVVGVVYPLTPGL